MTPITVDSVMEMVLDKIRAKPIVELDEIIDYKLVMKSLTNMKDFSTQTLRDLINELQGEIDSRPNPDNVECNICGSTDLEMRYLLYAISYWWCNKCQDKAEREVVYTKWDCEEDDIMNERGVTE